MMEVYTPDNLNMEDHDPTTKTSHPFPAICRKPDVTEFFVLPCHALVDIIGENELEKLALREMKKFICHKKREARGAETATQCMLLSISLRGQEYFLFLHCS